MSISVIVPTRNEEHNITRFLSSVPDDIQLVVCDASTDRTLDLVEQLRQANTLVLPCGESTIAEARQRGALASSGDVLVFTDADVTFDSMYFQRLQVRTDWDGMCGAKVSRGPYARDYELMRRAQTIAYHWLGIAAASGSNMAMTREAFLRLGGFREKLRCNEDTELFLRGGRCGLRMVFEPDLVVWAHDHRRLQQGRLHKVLHSLVRNSLLYVTCRWPELPRILEHDWGYWSQRWA